MDKSASNNQISVASLRRNIMFRGDVKGTPGSYHEQPTFDIDQARFR